MIFGISIIHVYTYIIRTLFFPVATYGHLPSNDKQPDRLCPVAAAACSRYGSRFEPSAQRHATISWLLVLGTEDT